jgi:hypothetical protein
MSLGTLVSAFVSSAVTVASRELTQMIALVRSIERSDSSILLVIGELN